MARKRKIMERWAPVEWTDPISLSKGSRRALVQISALDEEVKDDRADEMCLVVEQLLGRYRLSLKVLDEKPRPASQDAALEAVENQALGLLDSLDCLDYKSRQTLCRKRPERGYSGFELHEAKTSVNSLLEAVSLVRSSVRDDESRGRPSKRSEEKLARQLSEVSSTYSRPERYENSSEAQMEKLRLDFIAAAFRAGGIRRCYAKEARLSSAPCS